MDNMKKMIIFLACAVLLIGAARVVSLNYQDRPEDWIVYSCMQSAPLQKAQKV